MATYTLDEVLNGAGKKTYTLDEVMAQPKSDVVGSNAVNSLSEIPRQLGLATRYGVEGLADTAGIFTNPLTVMSNRLLGTNLNTVRGATSNLLDKAGLPSPNTAQERVIGDASRMLSGTGGLIKAGAMLPSTAISNAITSRSGMQAASSIGAGYAGGTARENGAGFGGQLGASLIGGILAPLSVSGLSSLANSAGNALKNTFAPQTIDIQVENVLRQSGIDLSNLHGNVVNSIRNDVRQALSTGQDISPDAVRRLADYKNVGATPMRSNLTLDPAQITRDRNTAKLGINSTDTTAQTLGRLQNSNNNQLIENLNLLGANTKDDTYSAGSKIISALQARDDAAKNVIGSFYKDARATDGRSANLDPHAFTNQANNLLDEALLGGKLPADVRGLLNKAASGEMPLTVDTAEQFKTRIGDLQRASTDPAERLALGKVRQALDNTPLLDNSGEGAINAFNKARGVNRAYMQNVEKTPALEAVRDGIEPDKFVNQFIIGNGSKSSAMDVAMLKKNLKGDASSLDAVKGQILAHIKQKALNGNADEVGNFSPTAYNKALDSIGDVKLKLFFTNQEIEQMKSVGRVASYENFQPRGSAVNNSNAAGALANHALDFLNKIPFGKAIAGDPIQNIMLSYKSKNALNAPNALALPVPRKPMPIPLFPLLSSGLLSTE
jgi:hypothetical protein